MELFEELIDSVLLFTATFSKEVNLSNGMQDCSNWLILHLSGLLLRKKWISEEAYQSNVGLKQDRCDVNVMQAIVPG